LVQVKVTLVQVRVRWDSGSVQLASGLILVGSGWDQEMFTFNAGSDLGFGSGWFGFVPDSFQVRFRFGPVLIQVLFRDCSVWCKFGSGLVSVRFGFGSGLIPVPF